MAIGQSCCDGENCICSQSKCLSRNLIVPGTAMAVVDWCNNPPKDACITSIGAIAYTQVTAFKCRIRNWQGAYLQQDGTNARACTWEYISMYPSPVWRVVPALQGAGDGWSEVWQTSITMDKLFEIGETGFYAKVGKEDSSSYITSTGTMLSGQFGSQIMRVVIINGYWYMPQYQSGPGWYGVNWVITGIEHSTKFS